LVAPPARFPQSGPVSNVTVWEIESLFVQVTVEPTPTDAGVGTYVLFWIATASPPLPVHATAAAEAAGALPPAGREVPLGPPPPHAAKAMTAVSIIRNCKKRTATSSSGMRPYPGPDNYVDPCGTAYG
jgi:hypothetical protein